MEKIKEVYNKLCLFLRYNLQFTMFVFLSTFACLFLRTITIGNWYSVKTLLFDFCVSLLIATPCYFYKVHSQFKYLLTTLCIITLMCIVNCVYYDWYSSYASFSLLTTLGQAGEVSDAIFSKLRVIHFSFLIFPVIFYFFNHYLRSRDYFNFVFKFEESKRLFKSTLKVGLCFFALGLVTLSPTSYSRLFKNWNREYTVSRFGITVYQINDLFSTLRPTVISWFGYDKALKNFNDYFEKYTPSKSSNEYTNKFKDYNIIFVHMESMTSMLIDNKINGESIASNLTKLSKEGLYFSHFYPQIGVGTSSDTEFTLNSSLLPASSGTVFVSYYDRNYITIPKLLSEKEYYTFSMHGNKAAMWNRQKMHPSLGYKDFYSSSSYDIDEIVGLGLSDKSFFKQSINILEEIEKNNNKYMGTIITLSNHTPFENNDLFDQLKLDYDGKDENGNNVTYSYLDGTKLGDYFRSAHYADQALGEFINYVKKSDYFNNTLFVFYGDHDPKISIKDFNTYYNYNFETGEIYSDDDENYVNYDYFSNELNKNTPLIIWTKNNSLEEQVDYYMGMIDVMPTVGNMVGIYNKYALGHDIFEIKDDNIVSFPNGNFLTSKLYYKNSNETYRVLSLDETLSDDYINYCRDYTLNIINISNDIIVHNLIENKDKKVIK